MSSLDLIPVTRNPEGGQVFKEAERAWKSGSLGAFLGANPAVSIEAPIEASQLEQPLAAFSIDVCRPSSGLICYWPPGHPLTAEAECIVRELGLVVRHSVPPTPGPAAEHSSGQDGRSITHETSAVGSPTVIPANTATGVAVNSAEPGGPSEAAPPSPAAPSDPPTSLAAHPTDLQDSDVCRMAYGHEIESVASFLRPGLSVLVYCDKLVVRHLIGHIARTARLREVILELPEDASSQGPLPSSLLQRQMSWLRDELKTLKVGDVLVIPHMDLLAGGSDRGLSNEARELTELLYAESDRLLLAFADRSITIPEVLSARFAVRTEITGLPRTVKHPDGRQEPVGVALVTRSEVQHFQGYNPEGLYKNVAGMNPIRLRHALTYAVSEYGGREPVPVTRLYEAIRAFKAQTSSKFEVPDVHFEDIGGYDEVKAQLDNAIRLIGGNVRLPNERLRRELMPKGFIFHGPPGTGKTLFAKAIANRLNAAIQVVSGPEINDMWYGESERKVREIFADARRNAPSVLVFDEFDSIASRRSGQDQGGARAGNAVVAQLLTEMDGFRPDVPILVIGTTNRLDILDDALLRPSRFQPIGIGLPDRIARKEIAQVHARHFGIEVAPELLEVIADASHGFNGDQLRSIFRDACVGLYCHTPPLPVDACRLGFLVGKIRAGMYQEATTRAPRPNTRQDARQTNRPGPAGTMIPLTGPAQAP